VADPTAEDLTAAAEAGRLAGAEGVPIERCPYTADEQLQTHVWLRWHSWARLTAAGFPT
jgi:hypothetical protein